MRQYGMHSFKNGFIAIKNIFLHLMYNQISYSLIPLKKLNMAQIATYEQWIARSNYDWKHGRSADLKKLDKKVEYYFVNWKGSNHERAKADVLDEFHKYVKSKWAEKPEYRPMGAMGITLSNRHPRNKSGAFDDLRTTILTNTFVVDKSMQDAQNFVMAAQANLLESLLTSKTGVPLKFTLKQSVSIKEKFKAEVRAAAVTVKAPFNGGKTFATGAVQNNPTTGNTGKLMSTTDKIKAGGTIARGVDKTVTAVQHLTNLGGVESTAQQGANATRELTPILGPEIAGHVGTAIGEVVPILGHIISGVNLIRAAVAVAQVHMLKDDLVNMRNMGYTAPGAPDAALGAVITLYKRIAVQKDINLGMATAKFGAQFDPTRTASAVVGAADAARKIVELIALMILEYKEVEAANQIITMKFYNKDFEQMFVSCPLLGAYVVVGSDHSSLINVAVKFYGTSGWQLSVEHMRKEVEKLIVASRDLIAKSKYEIQGFPKTKMLQRDVPQSCVSLAIRGGRPRSGAVLAAK